MSSIGEIYHELTGSGEGKEGLSRGRTEMGIIEERVDVELCREVKVGIHRMFAFTASEI